MVVFKRKQIVVLALILMIVVAGYLQYSYKQGSTSAGKDNGKLGEAVYVDNQLGNEEIDTAMDAKKDEKPGKKTDVSASKLANDFFAQAKMDKEISRSKSSDSLKAITEDVNASKEIRAEAYDKMMALLENADKEMRIETLIREKGFSDAVALFADDGSIDIIVKAASLTTAQTAQIGDIVSRQAKIAFEDIHIKKLF
ncbi:MAG: SpoIIIAH-like family protein [Ruminiclostridium sp.]|nr:SpoIIIAH-like family protein [Ruminiclostridium sp.]